MIPVRPVARTAKNWANAIGLALHRVKRIDARNLYIELRSRVLIEQAQRALRCAIPLATNRRLETADTAQFQLHRLG
jgi:hypothetical protein